ncbi:MAG: TRAP transporter small permease subunit [Sterolibacterium sp.]|jgi:TRAP-type mannitol/chloroaromatic compound transport system permease small subunit
MNSLLQISRLIDALNERVGRSIYWLILAAVLVSAINASIRKAFDMSSNAFLEMQWYMFSAVFLLGSGYTLLRQEHIRIDVIYGKFSRRTQIWIDIFGTVFFLLPMCLMFLYLSWPFFLHSIQSGETSANAGGLILWPVKVMMPLGFALLLIQGLSELVKRLAFQQGLGPDPGEKKQDKTAEEELAEAIKAHLVAPEVVDVVASHDAMHADRKDGSAA